jgi:DNA-binding XRE family transcriptional regulator
LHFHSTYVPNLAEFVLSGYYKAIWKRSGRAHLGVQVFLRGRGLSFVENGKKTPSIELVLIIAQMFDVTTDELLKDDLEVE